MACRWPQSLRMNPGLVIDALRDALARQRPKFLYLIPAFQNPSGHTLTEERRQQLLALARETDLLLVADEVYQFLNYNVEPPRCFGAYCNEPNVISLSSFSKILAPGLRLGWLQAHPTILKRLAGSGLLDSGGGMNPFTSAIVRSVIESGDLKQNIARLREVYAGRIQATDAALQEYLPEAEYRLPAGGYFFWLRLPGIDTLKLREQAAAHHVDFRPGSLFTSHGGLREYLRLGISFYDTDEIIDGVRRLAECLQRAANPQSAM